MSANVSTHFVWLIITPTLALKLGNYTVMLSVELPDFLGGNICNVYYMIVVCGRNAYIIKWGI